MKVTRKMVCKMCGKVKFITDKRRGKTCSMDCSKRYARLYMRITEQFKRKLKEKTK